MKQIFLILVCGFLLISCRDLVENESPEFPPVPVINGILRAGSPVAVHVSLASKLDTTQLNGLEDAVVELYVNDEFRELMQPMSAGWFMADELVQDGVRYTCKLFIPGFEMAQASTTIPAPKSIRDIKHISIAGKDSEGMSFPGIQFTFENDPSSDLYFEARIRVFARGDERTPWMVTITDPVLLNEGLTISVFSNEIITEDQYTMFVTYFSGSAGSSGEHGEIKATLYPFILELRSVCRDYYLFSRQKYLYDTGRWPEFGLNANIAFPLHSNVDGGYGIFAGYSTFSTDTIFPRY